MALRCTVYSVLWRVWQNILVLYSGGKERTADEYRDLLAAAGFRLNRIVPTSGLVSVVEGVKG
jgi:hypothetical protein